MGDVEKKARLEDVRCDRRDGREKASRVTLEVVALALAIEAAVAVTGNRNIDAEIWSKDVYGVVTKERERRIMSTFGIRLVPHLAIKTTQIVRAINKNTWLFRNRLVYHLCGPVRGC